MPASTRAPPASWDGARVSPSTAKAIPETTGSSVEVTLTWAALIRVRAAK